MKFKQNPYLNIKRALCRALYDQELYKERWSMNNPEMIMIIVCTFLIYVQYLNKIFI
ncbi:hypothetical protein P4L29_18375 [Bacillus cereus]|nr:hypothetical protein [Bacillus cereus]